MLRLETALTVLFGWRVMLSMTLATCLASDVRPLLNIRITAVGIVDLLKLIWAKKGLGRDGDLSKNITAYFVGIKGPRWEISLRI